MDGNPKVPDIAANKPSLDIIRWEGNPEMPWLSKASIVLTVAIP